MASSSFEGEKLEELTNRLSLHDDEEEGIVVPTRCPSSGNRCEEFIWCLVGRVHTDKFFIAGV